MYHYMLKSIKRQKYKSALVILVNCTLVILLNLYFGMIDNYRTRLDDLAAVTPIKCTVTNPDGTREIGISVDTDRLRALQESEYVKDLDCAAQLKAGFGEFEEAHWEQNLNLDVRVINRSNSSVLPDDINVHYLDGWDETMFAGDERVCVLKKSDMDKQGYICGDEVDFTVYYYVYDDIRMDMDILEFGYVHMEIVGEIDDDNLVVPGIYPDVLVPLQTMWDLFEERQIDFTADAASFYIKNPLEINDFKDEMTEMGFTEINKEARPSHTGSALYVQDGTFITLAGRLKTAIRILSAFVFPTEILIFIIGYVISHLLCAGRVKEFALFRSLGVKQFGTVTVFGCEQMLLSFGGTILGCLVMLLVGWLDIKEIVMVWGVVFCGYMLGTTVALLLLAHKAPLWLLGSE